MPTTSFERTIRELCEEILSEPTPKALPDKIIEHLQKTFPIQWSTLWLTEQTDTPGEKRIRLAAAGGDAKKLMEAENGKPAVYNFGEGLTGYIAQSKEVVNITRFEDFSKYRQHARKYDHVMYPDTRAEDKCRCVLGLPLLLRSIIKPVTSEESEWRVIGVLKLENFKESGDHRVPYFTPDDVEVVRAYAAVIAVALEKAQMRADSIRIGAGLLEVSHGLLAKLGERPDLNEIVRQTASVISAEACALWLRSGLRLRLEAAHGYPGKFEIKDVPFYELKEPAENPGQPPPFPTQLPAEQARFRNVGLTVYVGQTGKPLNLKTVDEVRMHFAWKGVNDERMWAKNRDACYSLVAIPLMDNETGDLKGVFKIENKRPTLFQLESFFTWEDEQLLTILGNSISLSLIISERIERLRRLERLVGDVRFLENLDEALFFILTGLTHRDGLEYNRAMIFLVDEARPTRLTCQYAVGQVEPERWQEEVDRSKGEPPLDLDMLVGVFRNNPSAFTNSEMMKLWKGCEIDISDPGAHVVAHHAAALDFSNPTEPSTKKYDGRKLHAKDFLHGFAQDDFVLIPITFEKKLKAIIYADHRFTGNRVNRFECEVLDLFAGMAAAIIRASAVPGKLQKERDEAWKSFSRPAAHRVGTEATIIHDEAVYDISYELDQAEPAPGQRLAVRGDVIRNSLQVILQAVNRLRLAVRDYQRLAADPKEPETFDLRELIDEAIENTTSKFKGIRVLPQSVGQPIWVRASRSEIAYVFEELLINAWKQVKSIGAAGNEEHRTAITVRIDYQHERDRILCTVSDNGRGVPKNLLATLFEKTGSGLRGGTGLGLYLCRQILGQNGGSIELITAGKPTGYEGACFRITLPLDASRQADLEPLAVPPGPQILVVEDNPTLRARLSRVLAENGFSSELACNEKEALQRFSTTLRAIVADINLRDAEGDKIGGILLAKELAMLNSRVPIILISHDPWYYLPTKDGPEFRKMQADCRIQTVLDRNTESFYDEVIKNLRVACDVA